MLNRCAMPVTNHRLLCAVSLAGFCLFLTISKAHGFASFCFNVHGDITTAALNKLNASPCTIAKVIAGNIGQDQTEGQGWLASQVGCNLASKVSYSINGQYVPAHHFDRVPVTSSIGAALAANLNDFLQSRSYLITQWNAVQTNIASGNNDAALAALGRGLHALQDFFAHSNYVDLAYGLAGNPGDSSQALAAVLDMTGTLQPPASLLFTSYGSTPGGDLEQPPDILNYTHGTYAKDWALKNPESQISLSAGVTKFTAAENAAIAASSQFINSIPGVSKILNAANCNPKSHSGQIIESGDPNDKSGPQGVGSSQWLSILSPVPYAIFYTNEATASAPAQKVIITDPIDVRNFDLNTAYLGPIGIPNGVVTPPSVPLAQNPFNTTVDLRPYQNLLLRITASLSSSTGTVMWTFQSLDPNTSQPPTNPLIGFLAPGTQGSVALNLTPKSGLATGGVLENQATIVFDANAPIATQQWTNMVDGNAPTSSAGGLPTTENATSFSVSWSGTDVGAGIQDYTIDVSDNGGPFVAWLTNTNQTSAFYSGVGGHTYGFYSIARDLVGNVEKSKTGADKTTTVPLTPTCAANVSSQILVNPGGFRYNSATKQFVQSISLLNVSPTTVGGPLSLVLDQLSPNASVIANSGVTACAVPANSPYINAGLGASGALASGQSISVTLQFNDPSLTAITYTPRVLAGPQGR